MRWILSVLTVVLLVLWNIRWTEVEDIQIINGATMEYKKDNWTGQTWLIYGSPLAHGFIEIPLVIASERFDSSASIKKELEQHAISGYLVNAWRKRDVATYIWINLTVFGFIGAIVGFWKKMKK